MSTLTTSNAASDGTLGLQALIDALKKSEQEAKAERDYAEATIRTARDPFVVLRADLRVNSANEAFFRTFDVSPAETVGRLIYEVGNVQWNHPKLRALLEDLLPRDGSFSNFEVTHDFP